MKMTLMLTSDDNPDWNGIWHKQDVEQDMRELYQTDFGENDWMRWVFNHMFVCEDFTTDIENFICENKTLSEVTFKFKQGTVKINVL